jgi:hypothetical protein
MPRELKGWALPRPLRVAFLIEDGEHASLTLDGVFADCYNRWGGRFSLIAPCLNGRIAPGYWPWLEAYDPDIVYSGESGPQRGNRTGSGRSEITRQASPGRQKIGPRWGNKRGPRG